MPTIDLSISFESFYNTIMLVRFGVKSYKN